MRNRRYVPPSRVEGTNLIWDDPDETCPAKVLDADGREITRLIKEVDTATGRVVVLTDDWWAKEWDTDSSVKEVLFFKAPLTLRSALDRATPVS